MIKFGYVFLALLAASAFLSVLMSDPAENPANDPTVARNQRLTAFTGIVIYVLLVAIAITVIRISSLLTAHYLVGFLLLPPLILKLGSTGYRFVRYYAGSAAFRLAGAPPVLLRFVVAPVLVASTVILFASGIELWLFGLRFGSAWIEAHSISAVVMIAAAAAHVLAHLRRSGDVMLDEISGRGREAISRRSVVLASVVAGSVLAVASLLYASPFTASVAGG
ncbi:MAG TPA: hypothetical protein VJQ08_02185 [Candidatus Dormibacteraeota bacterium]|nr:hypothetical protein [Candidatus Dormibacteraeota bacterium]